MMSDTHADAPRLRLEQLRERRPRLFEPRTLTNDLVMIEKTLRRSHRSLAAVASLWTTHCPPRLLPRTAIVSMNRSVLTIAADDASTRFELDRWLRGGAEDRLIAASTTPLGRIKVILGAA